LAQAIFAQDILLQVRSQAIQHFLNILLTT